MQATESQATESCLWHNSSASRKKINSSNCGMADRKGGMAATSSKGERHNGREEYDKQLTYLILVEATTHPSTFPSSYQSGLNINTSQSNVNCVH